MSNAQNFSSFAEYQKYRKSKKNRVSSDSDETIKKNEIREKVEQSKENECLKDETISEIVHSSDNETYNFAKKLKLNDLLIYYENDWNKKNPE
eukprot:gene2208-2382_t